MQKNKRRDQIAALIIISFGVLLNFLLFHNKGTDDGYSKLNGYVFSGVKVYQGSTHDYVFQILGVNDRHTFDDGRAEKALKIRTPDGYARWQGYDDVIRNDSLSVKNDDPALRQAKLTVYDF